MTMREEFDEWYRREYWDFLYQGKNHAPFAEAINSYNHMDVQLAWASWQAAYVAGQKAMQQRAVAIDLRLAAQLPIEGEE